MHQGQLAAAHAALVEAWARHDAIVEEIKESRIEARTTRSTPEESAALAAAVMPG